MKSILTPAILILLFGHSVFGKSVSGPFVDPIESAELVVSGKVTKVSYYRAPELITIYSGDDTHTEEKSLLQTDFEVEILEILKGDFDGSNLILTKRGACLRIGCDTNPDSWDLYLDDEIVVAIIRSESQSEKWRPMGERGVFLTFEENGDIMLISRDIGRKSIDWLLEKIQKIDTVTE